MNNGFPTVVYFNGDILLDVDTCSVLHHSTTSLSVQLRCKKNNKMTDAFTSVYLRLRDDHKRRLTSRCDHRCSPSIRNDDDESQHCVFARACILSEVQLSLPAAPLTIDYHVDDHGASAHEIDDAPQGANLSTVRVDADADPTRLDDAHASSDAMATDAVSVHIYGNTPLVSIKGKPPVLKLFDVRADPLRLGLKFSTKQRDATGVQRCAWIAHVPSRVLDVEHTSMLKAVIALHEANRTISKSRAYNVYATQLCVHHEHEVFTLHEWIEGGRPFV